MQLPKPLVMHETANDLRAVSASWDRIERRPPDATPVPAAPNSYVYAL
jgi:hypothetical protein